MGNTLTAPYKSVKKRPTYAELPEPVQGYPSCADYFNSLQAASSDGKDQLGTLNHLTKDRTAEAAKEILLGEGIALDAPLNLFAADSQAFGGRQPCRHQVLSVGEVGREDALHFNTQASSQWDGLRHFGIRAGKRWYNGVSAEELAASEILGTQVWTERGGIVGRGVLVDFLSWAEGRGETVEVNTGRAITLDDVLAILKHQKTTVKPGDVLLFRTGWLRWYRTTPQESRHNLLCIAHDPGTHSFIGLAAHRDFLAWLWDNEISAVAADSVAFESTPPPETGGWLHDHLLGALGMPIGELWNLEELAERCKEQKRFTFFLSSTPLHVPGGVASPANAVAIL
ncbi:cyclase protein [Leucosporidium creatinivorum]|uniref:Cyclase protein n=1 Tax=Leucosporidium creatinivorum TaxID=106004 RepID=A0A1Y2EVM3_9BASI|nr:cyclase protein [Leucosporidium creatinivorum]